MTTIRKKKIGNNEYLYEQKSERQGDKVKTRHVRYIGKTTSEPLIGIGAAGVSSGGIAHEGITLASGYTVAAGIGLYVGGLFVFNRHYIKYQKAKADKEVNKQDAAVSDFAIDLKKRYPKMSDAQARAYAKKELSRRYVEDMNKERKKNNDDLDEPTGFYRQQKEKARTRFKSPDEMYRYLRKNNPEMSDRNINNQVMDVFGE